MPESLAQRFFSSRWPALLAPIAAVYGAVAAGRRRRLAARAERLDAPVLSVGNITVGGTGKTPVVELVARRLLERGRAPAILSRGYGKTAGRARGRDGGAVNDEFLVLERNLPEVPHFPDRDRVAGGRRAIAAGADVLVLDDGFQHTRLRRDLDIVLIDATCPFGYGRVLPAGLLREPVDALVDAGVIAITRGRLVDPESARLLDFWLAERFPSVPRIAIDFEPVAWRSLEGAVAEPLAAHAGARVVACAGIGNPEGFRRQLLALGLTVARWIPFLDHHIYTLAEVDDLDRLARRTGADLVVMTQKDAVKIPWRGAGAAGERPWRYLEIRPSVSRGAARFESLIDRSLASWPSA